jgi:hypothetical protein
VCLPLDVSPFKSLALTRRAESAADLEHPSYPTCIMPERRAPAQRLR